MNTETKPAHTPTQGKPTPTPWYVATSIKEFVPKSQGGGLKVRLLGSGMERLGTMNASEDTELAQANAAHIVKCVNAHEELLNAIKEAHASLIGASIHSQHYVNKMLLKAISLAEK